MTTFDQPTMFDIDDWAFAPTPALTLPTIDEAFDAFHTANPWVYHALVKLARDLRDRGHDVIGMKMLFEVLRWQWYMTTTDAASPWKLNNNYTSRYARLIMSREPDLDGAFNTRELSS